MKHIGELTKRLYYVVTVVLNVVLHNRGLYASSKKQAGMDKYFQEEINCVGR